jgi:NTE family protein
VVGGCYAAGALDDMEAFARSLTRRRVLSLMDLTFAGSGLIAGNRLKQRLERALGTMQIEDLPRKFAAVATEMGTGNEIWLTQGNLVEAVRASYALPGLFEPVRFGGRWLFDGALCNPIPVTVCRALGAEFVVAIDLVAEADRRSTVVSDGRVLNEALVELEAEAPKPSSSFLSGLSDRALRRLPFYASENGAPSMASAMIEAFNIIQDRLARSRLAGDPPDLQIAARVGKIGIFDFHRADELIQLGRDAVTKAATSLAERVGVPLLGPVSAS